MMVLGVLLLQLLQVTLVASQAKPGCPDKCGDISISYPFGIGENCSSEGFGIDCNTTDHGRFIPYISGSDVEITNISFSTGELAANQYIAMDCYNKSGFQEVNNISNFWLSTSGPFTFSVTQNKFTVLGCDTLAYIYTPGNVTEFQTGCVSVCENQSMVTNGSCNGIGCCQTSIPKGVKEIDILIESYNNHTNVSAFNPCSYAFLADLNWFTFHGLPDLSSEFYEKNNGKAPLVLDWAIGNQTCEEAKRAPDSDYACVSENSNCYDSTNGPGYRCNCNSGYEGNPYLHGGCQDIDECKNKVVFPCRGICTNTRGNYSCECPKGKHSIDPILFECKSLSPVEKVALGIGIPLILIVIGSWIYLGLQTRRFINMKEKFFKQNGGFDLQRLLSSHPSTTFKIFSKEELERATINFDEKNVLGRGGNGTIFKGVLPDNRVLAIKKSSSNNDEVINKQFANEIFILSQINHKNVVKLLGCCVEVEIPMLVYEFISNGTPFEFIHSRRRLCLNDCLRIATEAASALSYLHWDASPPILHGDVKSSNILLDKNLMVKVSDFGASKLTPKGTDQFVTFIQGTRGYLDPEYLQTGQLTDKSDVYSFGVVLLELLTRKMAFFRLGIEEERNLANVFLSAMKEERLIDVLDHEMVNEGRMDLILEVCNLAKRCLNIGGEERPTMREVAMELEGLIVFRIHPWVTDNSEDTERLIGGSSDIYIDESTDCYTADKSAIISIEAGR